MMSRDFPDPSRFWESSQALERARRIALRIARAEMEQRRLREEIPKQAIERAHREETSAAFFERVVLPCLDLLPSRFRALEIGAGMALSAALTAVRGAGLVLATEVAWEHDGPQGEANAHTMHRLAEREPDLRSSLEFQRRSDGHLIGVRFHPPLVLARADVSALPVLRGSMDLVFSINCIEHIPDVGGSFEEVERVLRIGGIFTAITEPLFFSSQGHHIGDIFPVPWGHLLWEPEALAELAVREAGEGREWAPGVPLRANHLLGILRTGLNGVTPTEIRGALRRGSWRILAWVDLHDPRDEALAREMGLRDALRGISAEALFLRGLHFRLQRMSRSKGLRIPLRFSFRIRRTLRRAVRWR
jgi:SAM-dependent methyltransferase